MATVEREAWPAHAGYHAGVAQQSVPISIPFECPPLLQSQAVDAWLKKALDIEVAPLPDDAPRGVHEAVAAAFAWRGLHVAAALLRAIRLPAFEPGRIVALRRDKASATAWRLTALLPRADFVPQAAYAHAMRSAMAALRWLMARAPTDDNVRQLHRQLDEQFVSRPLLPTPVGSESTLPLLKEAHARGYPFRHLGYATYVLGWGSRRLVLDRGAIGPDSAIGAHVAGHKWRAATLLRSAGLPAPAHVLVFSAEAAAEAARSLGWPLVVKPADLERGEGVTTGIRDEAHLARAVAAASALSRSLLVERHVEGICHRIMVADGQVQFVTRRLAKAVKGDGVRTVRELVAAANAAEQAKPPWTRLKPFPLDDMAVECLRGAGLTPNSVPDEGSWALLRPMQTSAWGGVVEDFTDAIHPDNAQAAIRAAGLLGLTVAGIDMLTPDISKPWHENGAVINEVNYSPLLAGRSTSKAMAALLAKWLPQGGRIPVDVVVGGAELAIAQGRRLQAGRVETGEACWLVGEDCTLAPDGRPAATASQGLFARTIALLLSPGVDSIVMVAQDASLVGTGLPVDRVTRIVRTEGDFAGSKELLALLGAYAAGPADSM